VDLTPQNIRALRAELHREFRAAFDTTNVIYPQLTTTIPSGSARNDYSWTNNLPVMREWLGSRVVQNVGGFIYSVENKDWEMTIGVRRNDIEDDNLGFYANIARDYGEAARLHPDQLLFDLLKNGQSKVCYDGQFFFDTDHPVNGTDTAAGVYSNYFVGRPLNPTNYDFVRSQVIGLKGANGRAMGLSMDLLIVPPALGTQARRIVELQTEAGGAGNPFAGTARVLVIPELAGDDTSWYLVTTQRQIKPFIFQTRRPLSFVTKNAITDEVVLVENEVRFYADARYNVAYSLPFLAVKATA